MKSTIKMILAFAAVIALFTTTGCVVAEHGPRGGHHVVAPAVPVPVPAPVPVPVPR